MISWPDGKRIAVLVSVLLESWDEGRSPTYFTRTTPLKPGAVDHAGVQWSSYGGKEGIWRLLRTLETCGLPATVFCGARAAELYPDAVRQVVRSGHDIAAHGYSQDQYLSDMSADDQAALIRRCIATLEAAGGQRPEGWCSAVYGWNGDTVDMLARERLKWHTDALDTSLPRLERTRHGSIVAMPWCEFVDNRVLRSSPRDFYDVYKGNFDYLYTQEPMGLVHIAVHSHVGGRPMMTAVFHEILRYFQSFGDVWFPRHRDLARWVTGQKAEELSYAKRFFP